MPELITMLLAFDEDRDFEEDFELDEDLGPEDEYTPELVGVQQVW